jgi:2-polyprenyl-3-methyl-5-hydroxy-6-metoxy-1,4-benzoquinol methylase
MFIRRTTAMNNNLLRQFQAFRQLSGGFRASRVLLTANNYAVFEHLKTPKTAGALAKNIRTDPRATEILLDAVTALGLLIKTGPHYRNSPLATKFLTKNSAWYQGDMLRHSDTLWKNWSTLDDVVKTGQPSRTSERHHESFIRAMHNNAVFRAKEVIKAVDIRGIKKALDLGGGPGTYSIELARHGICVTLFDQPDTMGVAKKIVRESRAKNIDCVSGNFLSDDVGSEYDLVFISQIVHSLSIEDSLAILKKSYVAMNPGGKIAIQEFFLEQDRAHPVPGALFSVNMLVNTTAGRCYTAQELKAWLTKTGFKRIKQTTLGDTVIVTGRRD